MATAISERHIEPVTIPQLLERACAEQQISKSEAARRIGTSYQTYRAWEYGQTPRLEWVQPLAEFTGAPRAVILAAVGAISWDEAALLASSAANRDIPG